MLVLGVSRSGVAAGANLPESGRTEIADGSGAMRGMRAGDHSVNKIEASDLNLSLGAIALAIDTHGLGVVQQTVEQGRGEDGVVVEDAGPLNRPGFDLTPKSWPQSWRFHEDVRHQVQKEGGPGVSFW